MRALARGGRQRVLRDSRPGAHPVVLNHVLWDVSGDCQKPVTVEVISRPSDHPFKRVIIGPGKPQVWAVTMEVTCRKCENCLRRKAGHWYYRAMAEYRHAPRTWLWTLTLSPAAQAAALNRARKHLDAQGVDFDGLPAEEQFAMRHRETGRAVTLALKRLRKGGDGQPPCQFRYLMVAEAHASGLPHYHLLIHEIVDGAPVRHASLKRAWSEGFCDAKLIADEKSATYPLKYVAKSLLARVRASVAYGNPVTSSDIVGSGTKVERGSA